MTNEQGKKEISEVDNENWILRVKEELKSLCEKNNQIRNIFGFNHSWTNPK